MASGFRTALRDAQNSHPFPRGLEGLVEFGPPNPGLRAFAPPERESP